MISVWLWAEVGCFAGNHDIVRVAFTNASGGDADELGFLQGLDVFCA
jgi:hypothetical protein